MKKKLQFLTLFLLSNFLTYGQSQCTPIPEVNFPGGRVIMSFDGNVHDDDDIVAMGLSAGLWWAAGLQDKVVQIEYNNHVCSVNVVETDGTGPGRGYDGQNMRTTAAGAISNFGYNSAVFYDYERVATASTNKMASEIEKSTSSNPLWIIAGGPMETVWRALEKATKGHSDVTIISHSKWNQDHTHCSGANNWIDLKTKYQSRGVFFVENCSGSACNGPSGLNDQNGGFNSAISNWTWMRDSSKNYNRWIFGRNPFGSYFDPSDAGMSYFLITGGPFRGGDKTPDHNDARKLMENPCKKQDAPTPPTSAPSLSITSPSQGQTIEIGDAISVQLNASDDGAIVKHQIFVNNTLVDTDGGSYTPHSLKILKKETYTIRAEVTDNSGAKSTKTVTVTGIEKDETEKTQPTPPAPTPPTPTTPAPTPTPPTIVTTPQPSSNFDFSSPREGEVFKTGGTITVNLASGGTRFTLHKIYVNNKLVDTDGTNFTPHRITNAQNGNYTIRAEVTDTNGRISTKIVSVRVGAGAINPPSTPPNNPPNPPNPPVSGTSDFNVVSPTEGQRFATASNIIINLAARTASDIVKYQIYVNNRLVDTDGSRFTPHTVVKATNGAYVIRATVTKRNGTTSTKSVTVNVGGGNTSSKSVTSKQINSVALSVSPANGKTFTEGDNVPVVVSATSNNGRIVKHQIFVDGQLVDTDGAVFTAYTITGITAGDHSILVEVTDAKGNKKSQTTRIATRKRATSLVARLPDIDTDDLLETDLPAIRIVQNPVQSENLQVDVEGNMNLTILDLNGVVVKEIPNAEDKLDLDVSGLAPGVYILKSATDTAKFIIPGF